MKLKEKMGGRFLHLIARLAPSTILPSRDAQAYPSSTRGFWIINQPTKQNQLRSPKRFLKLLSISFLSEECTLIHNLMFILKRDKRWAISLIKKKVLRGLAIQTLVKTKIKI
jgi:hypothetical protein